MEATALTVAWFVMATIHDKHQTQQVTTSRYSSMAECHQDLKAILRVPLENGVRFVIKPSCVGTRPASWIEE